MYYFDCSIRLDIDRFNKVLLTRSKFITSSLKVNLCRVRLGIINIFNLQVY